MYDPHPATPRLESKPARTTMFLKNLSMLGGALMIAYFGSGPASLSRDSRAPENHAAFDDVPMKDAG